MSNQGLQAQVNGFSVRRRAAGLFRAIDEPLLDIQRLLHADVYTIHIWHIGLYDRRHSSPKSEYRL